MNNSLKLQFDGEKSAPKSATQINNFDWVNVMEKSTIINFEKQQNNNNM